MKVMILDQLLEHLRARDVALEGQERPTAILWTDPNGEWIPLLDTLLVQLNELLVLGKYELEFIWKLNITETTRIT